MEEENDVAVDGEERSNGRRDLLTKGAVAAAVAAVAGVGVASRASAADTDPIIIGNATNTGTNLTRLLGSTLMAENGQSPITDFGVPALYGATNNTEGIGVLGRVNGVFAVGVWGATTGTDGAGVKGTSDKSSPGVLGVNDGTYGGAAITGIATGNGPDLHAAGTGRVLLNDGGVANPPTGGPAGTIARDGAGNLWYAVATDSWRKLAGTGTAGSFHPINPARVYDSRLAAYAPNNGLMAPNTNRVISVKDGRDASGAVIAADVVPAGATAVAINVTVAGPTGPNFLSVVPGDAASFTASTINWPGGFDAANGTIVKVDTSRQLKAFCGDQSGSTHVIIDVTGYYL
jgi:hypothetical protein